MGQIIARKSFTTYRGQQPPRGCGPRVDRTVCNLCGSEAYSVYVAAEQDDHFCRRAVVAAAIDGGAE